VCKCYYFIHKTIIRDNSSVREMICNNNMGSLEHHEGCLGWLSHSHVMPHEKNIDEENSTHSEILARRHDDKVSHA
jgi:hypothetical protein